MMLSIGADHGAGYYDENNTLHDGPTHSMPVKWSTTEIGQLGNERTRRVIVYKDRNSKDVRYDLNCTGKPLLYVEDEFADYSFTTDLKGDRVAPRVTNPHIASLVCKEGDTVRFDSVSGTARDVTLHRSMIQTDGDWQNDYINKKV
ncbi:hypothetical protein I302_104291 [Kwoniella bestiolae CBS 10118]|uniref:Uncharacterized protein n=1 Tax=Kwoniella bestiolae CBS 10118 TaxID=1296100 RepID=A0A1B9GAV0_9TREE|nr:hypothetical protein I302_02998 [Kwoniella bestiolae CBS 10118]OCF28147.1 hypothetical protein I302_02998 [Kwoniella bestiolae CBS 10118]